MSAPTPFDVGVADSLARTPEQRAAIAQALANARAEGLVEGMFAALHVVDEPRAAEAIRDLIDDTRGVQ